MSFHLGSIRWTRAGLAFMLVAGSALLVSSTKPPYTERDKAFYADEALVNFVRPGLVFKIQGQEIAADGTVKVRFAITDPRGLPLDRLGDSNAWNRSIDLYPGADSRGSDAVCFLHGADADVSDHRQERDSGHPAKTQAFTLR